MKEAAGVFLAPYTGGASLQLSQHTQGWSPQKAVPAAAANLSGATATKNAMSALNASQQAEANQAAEMQRQLLLQPKNVSPDNFLSMKNRNLANMRLGLASTITGAGGSPSPVLSSPTLAAGGGKNKFGS